MKRNLFVLILMVVLSSCGPVPPQNSAFAGQWTTNVGRVNFQQTGNDLTGFIEGYGGGRIETFKGMVNADNVATFNTTWFGEFTLVADGDTFKSTAHELSFCGIRSSKSEELPAGCGFSGKWIVPANFVFLKGSYMILEQVGENVTGDLYNEDNTSYDSIAGKVEWGKGWRMIGTSAERGDITFEINGQETGFQILYGSPIQQSSNQHLCAFRDGQTSAYIMSFTCEP